MEFPLPSESTDANWWLHSSLYQVSNLHHCEVSESVDMMKPCDHRPWPHHVFFSWKLLVTRYSTGVTNNMDSMLGLLLWMHALLSVQSHKDQMAWNHLLKVVFLQLPAPKVYVCRLTLGGVSLQLTSRGGWAAHCLLVSNVSRLDAG